jgi:hypothetical protein
MGAWIEGFNRAELVWEKALKIAKKIDSDLGNRFPERALTARPPVCYNMDMRIVIGWDQFWLCPILAANIVRRLTLRYGPDIVIVHSDDTGVSESFALAAKGQRVKTEEYMADFDHLDVYRFRNREVLRPGAGLCIIAHRTLLDAGSKDLATQAISAEVPTYLIADEDGAPRRLRDGEGRLG